jgi:hypothetical protein
MTQFEIKGAQTGYLQILCGQRFCSLML